jgi:thiol-disulfide isomerase/thioredoxin
MKNFALLSCLLMFFAGCTEITGNPDDEKVPESGIELANGMSSSVVLHPKGSFVNVRFNSAADWHVELPADADWLEVSPLEGAAGTGRLKIKAEANLTGQTLTAEVHVCSEDDVLELNVSQENFVPKFELVESEAEMSFMGGPLAVKLLADMPYEYDCDADWVIPAETKADDDYEEILFEVSPNPGDEERTAVIAFTNGASTVNFTLTQGTDGLGSRDWKSEPFKHRSLAMRFTATWCGYCPWMAQAFDEAKAQMPEALEIVSLHTADSDLGFSGTRTLQNRFRATNLPTGVVDARASIPNYQSTATTAKTVLDVADETQKEYPASVGIACASMLSGSDLTATVGLYLKEAGKYRLTVLVLEDDITNYQNGGGNNYKHNDVARLALTSMSGEVVEVEAGGEFFVKSFTGKLRKEWITKNLKMLVYVEKPYGSQSRKEGVGNAEYADYGDTYIDNCCAVKLGESSTLEFK